MCPEFVFIFQDTILLSCCVRKRADKKTPLSRAGESDDSEFPKYCSRGLEDKLKRGPGGIYILLYIHIYIYIYIYNILLYIYKYI